MSPENTLSLESQITEWRNFLRHRQAIQPTDVVELEDHLREQVTSLTNSGLSTDESFLVAVKRMGDLDSISREFALTHSERLWKQLVVPESSSKESTNNARTDSLMAFGLAACAALLFKLPSAFGFDLDKDAPFYAKNASLFVLPFLTAYFAWKRQINKATVKILAAIFAAAVVFANIYPVTETGHTAILQAIHLPIILWLAVGIAYAAGRWNQVSGRMDFIRFSGELFIYYVLIALGGGVLTAFMALIFTSIGIDPEQFFESWLIPCGALGGVLVAAWLVEAKQSVIENMAPVLTRLFTPLFAALLVTFLFTMLFTGRIINIDRNMLIAFDLLLVVVLGLLLYSVSARDPLAQKSAFDVTQIVLLVSALLVDVVMLYSIADRLAEFGLSPNRLAALGLNIILLINLSWSAVLYTRFLKGQSPFTALERWQTNYLPVYAAWALVVVVLFPPLFRYI